MKIPLTKQINRCIIQNIKGTAQKIDAENKNDTRRKKK